jgi:prolyl oligopeptidase
MRVLKYLALCVIALSGLAGGLQALGANGAKEPKVTTDPYHWLEDVHGAKPLAWVKDQNVLTRKALAGNADYQADYDSVLAVLDAPDRIPLGAIRHDFVFNFWQDAQNPKGIWRRTSIEDYAKAEPKWDVLLDIDKLAKDEGKNWVFKGSECAPSMKQCLLFLSPGGGDAHVVREFDLKTKTFVKNGFALDEAKSEVTYRDDDTVLFASDFGKDSLTSSGYPRIVKMWKRGEPIAAAKTIFEGTKDDVGVAPMVMHGPKTSIALISRAISFFETEYDYVYPDGATLKLPLPLGAVVRGAVGDNLILTLRDSWTPPGADKAIPKGALVSFNVTAFANMKMPVKVDVLFTPDPRQMIDGVATGDGAVYAAIYTNVTGAIHVFKPGSDGAWSDTTLDLPKNGSTHIVSANDYGPQAQFTFESFLQPTTLYSYDGTGQPKAIKSQPARFDSSGLETEQFEATSKDGTKIPYFVVRAKDAKGPAPTLLYGYGGFEISQTPWYWANAGRLWLSKGGVIAVANIRGGGEFGPAWHKAALKKHRQRAFDDFEAVARDLSTRDITTPKQLGIMGGSNGGLLVSTVMTQTPKLLGAVVCQVPLIDMLRYTKIGAGASWIGEYGDPEKPGVRKYIEKYSPYQNVRIDKEYPPVLFVTATSDDRVTPVHARKMAARMEALGHDVLFYENTDGGHSAAADHKQAAEMWAMSFEFLKQKLGLGATDTKQ